MTESRLHRMFVVVLLAFAAVLVVLLLTAMDAPAAPLASQETTATLDDAQDWAQKWRRIAQRERRILVRHCEALGLQPPLPMATIVGYEDHWGAYGAYCKMKARYYHERTAQLHRRLVRPGGHGAARWWPLAYVVGWPRAQKAMLIRVIWRESNGNPRCTTPPYGAAGLLQFIAPHYRGQWSLPAFNPYDPETNLKMGLRLWRAQGWRPWALTAW